MNAPLDYATALEYLYSRLNFERSSPPYHSPAFRLKRMRELLRRMGDPHRGAPTIHVAGTKGKGSTCVLLERVLREGGAATGLYSSPHLCRLEERFQIDGQECSEQELVELVAAVRPAVAELDRLSESEGRVGPTFFEITTAMAMECFRKRRVDWFILETGLGGRLDSTNVCEPTLCILTSISLDHMRQLGSTVEKIAREKAGVIKPGAAVISGVVEPGPAAVIADAARRAETPLEVLGVDFHVDYRAKDDPLLGGFLDYRDEAGTLDGVELAMAGEHQARNAALAIRAVRRLQPAGANASEQTMRRGLAQAVSPCRVELFGRRPPIILDVAHNDASIAALLETLESWLTSKRPSVLIFSASRDKDALAMLRRLAPRFDHLLLTCFSENPRATPLHQLETFARQAIDETASDATLQAYPNQREALEAGRSLASEDGMICVTGSFFLAGQLRRWVTAAE